MPEKVSLSACSEDLGDSSNYSSESLESRRGEGFHVNSI